MSDLAATLAAVHRHGGRLRYRDGVIRLAGLGHVGLRQALAAHKPALLEGVDAAGPTKPCPICTSPSYWREAEADAWRCAECEVWPHDRVQTLVVEGGRRRTTGTWAGDRAAIEERRARNRAAMPEVSDWVDDLRAAISAIVPSPVAVTYAIEGEAEHGMPDPPSLARTVIFPERGRPRAMTESEAGAW